MASTHCVIAVLLPAMCISLYVFAPQKNSDLYLWTLAIVFLQPASILIDHGHFQFNGISLGLSVRLDVHPAYLCQDQKFIGYNLYLTTYFVFCTTQAAAASLVVLGWEVSGSVAFCLAINHKHMSVYYAPAFLSHLLGRCLQRGSPARQASFPPFNHVHVT